jgi:hypothetical protein
MKFLRKKMTTFNIMIHLKKNRQITINILLSYLLTIQRTLLASLPSLTSKDVRFWCAP